MLSTNPKSSVRDKLSLRMLYLVLLVLVYSLLSIWIGSGKWHAVALCMPAGLVGLLASARRILSPYVVTVVGLIAYAFVLAAVSTPSTGLGLFLTILHMATMVVIGLVLSEIQIVSTASRADEDALKHEERVISLARLQRTVAEEMRRCRRHDLPMSLILFRTTTSESTHTRVEQINSVSSVTREFDQLFSLSRSELGVLCLDTDRQGAMRLVSRIQKNLALENIAIASFPEDAVTSTALIDVMKNGTRTITKPELTAVAE